MIEVSCVNCNRKISVEKNNISNIIATGFNVAFDISNGMDDIIVCNECANKIKKSVQVIEDICKKPIDEINLQYFSSMDI